MAKELTVYSGPVEGFVIRILDSSHRITEAEEDQAANLYRGCGLLRRYIAMAMVAGYGGQDASDYDRSRLDILCRTKLHCEIKEAMRQARHAETEISVFGPMVASAERLAQSMSRDCAEQLARLPECERKTIYDECVELHTGDGGICVRSPRFVTDLTHIVNRRLKELGPALPAAPPDPETPKSTTPPASAKAPDSITVSTPPADLFDGADEEDDGEDPLGGNTQEEIDAEEAHEAAKYEDDTDPFVNHMGNPLDPTIHLIEVSEVTFNRLLLIAAQYKCATIPEYLDGLAERMAGAIEATGEG